MGLGWLCLLGFVLMVLHPQERPWRCLQILQQVLQQGLAQRLVRP